MLNLMEMQAQFMTAGGQRINRLTDVIRQKTIDPQILLYMNLIEEEVKELEDAMAVYMSADYPDTRLAAIADIADAIGDIAVVMMGLCVSMGIPFHEIYNEIHRSNMLKCVKQQDGSYKILRRADGKIIKPANWEKPRLLDILKYRLINGY